HVAHVLLRSHDLDLHDRLKQLDACLLGRSAHGAPPGDLECHRARADVVVLAADPLDGEVDDWEADQRTALPLLAHALLNRRDVLAGDVTALDLVVEDHALAALARGDDHFRLTELTRTTRLLLVGVGDFDFTGEALAIRHLRCTNVGLNLELA